LYECETAQIGRPDEAREVTDYTTAEGEDKGLALDLLLREFVVTILHYRQVFGSFPGGNANFMSLEPRFIQMFDRESTVKGTHVPISNDDAFFSQSKLLAFNPKPWQQLISD